MHKQLPRQRPKLRPRRKRDDVIAACEHRVYPPINCDICFPLYTEDIINTVASGGESRGGAVPEIPVDWQPRCEVDGEPMAGVEHISVEIDRDGKLCVMVLTDPILAEHFKAQAGQRANRVNDCGCGSIK